MDMHNDCINRYDEALVFSVIPAETADLFISYYDINGDIIMNGMSTKFYPESTVFSDSPASATIIPGDEMHYEMTLFNLHYNQPIDAVFWALFFNPISITKGVMEIGQYIKLENFIITSWPNTV